MAVIIERYAPISSPSMQDIRRRWRPRSILIIFRWFSLGPRHLLLKRYLKNVASRAGCANTLSTLPPAAALRLGAALQVRDAATLADAPPQAASRQVEFIGRVAEYMKFQEPESIEPCLLSCSIKCVLLQLAT
jgi:hypothetical protein